MPLSQAEADLKRRRLQQGRDASDAAVARPEGQGFHPEDLV
jgi:hypothetical protein